MPKKVKLQSSYSLDPNGMVQPNYSKVSEEPSIPPTRADENFKLRGLNTVPHDKKKRKNNKPRKAQEDFPKEFRNSWASSVTVNPGKKSGSAERFYGNSWKYSAASEYHRDLIQAKREAYDAGHSDGCHHRYDPDRYINGSGQSIFEKIFIFSIFLFGFIMFLIR